MSRVLSEKHKRKLSIARKRYYENPKHRQLASDLNQYKGRHIPDEICQKISQALKLFYKTNPATGCYAKGSKRSDEFRRKTSKRKMGIPLSEEARRKMILTKKNNPEPNYFKCGKDNIMYGRHHSREHKLFMSRVMKEIWANEEWKNRCVMASMRGNARKPNTKELALSYMLRHISPKCYQYNGDARVGIIIGGKIPDFVNINGKKQVIELLGNWWHGEQIRGRTREQEAERLKSHYTKFGFDCLIVWEDELKHKVALRDKMREFVIN